jgi:hypothetical protein
MILAGEKDYCRAALVCVGIYCRMGMLNYAGAAVLPIAIWVPNVSRIAPGKSVIRAKPYAMGCGVIRDAQDGTEFLPPIVDPAVDDLIRQPLPRAGENVVVNHGNPVARFECYAVRVTALEDVGIPSWLVIVEVGFTIVRAGRLAFVTYEDRIHGSAGN